MERGHIADFRHRLDVLLLSPTELASPYWQPAQTLSSFFQYRVRPAVYFIQRCAFLSPHDDVLEMPAAERAELRDFVLRLAGTVVRCCIISFPIFFADFRISLARSSCYLVF
jgi:hypothetical protein